MAYIQPMFGWSKKAGVCVCVCLFVFFPREKYESKAFLRSPGSLDRPPKIAAIYLLLRKKDHRSQNDTKWWNISSREMLGEMVQL